MTTEYAVQLVMEINQIIDSVRRDYPDIYPWLEDSLTREAAARYLIDQRTRIALWRLCKDSKYRNRHAASIVGEWLADHNQREPEDAPSRQEILDRDGGAPQPDGAA